MLTATFWKATIERAGKTFAQALVAYFGTGGVFDAFHANWGDALGVAAGATVLSVLTSIASANLGPTGTPSLVRETTGRALGSAE